MRKRKETEFKGGSMGCRMDFPSPPEELPRWALEEAKRWQRKDEFDVLVMAEELCGRSLEVRYTELPDGMWGFHICRTSRGAILINSSLPPFWRRFTLFHEVYHIIHHPKGQAFFDRTLQPLSRFEQEADHFAWAAVWPEWIEGDYRDW
ncbi:MAG: ImmA/IrrE family metallo-endopeptidase [Thermanaerothrix sp.]|nr:ImmA/IrrE family metallo-endopeptidase [Thermanaerothrix sp.]